MNIIKCCLAWTIMNIWTSSNAVWHWQSCFSTSYNLQQHVLFHVLTLLNTIIKGYQESSLVVFLYLSSHKYFYFVTCSSFLFSECGHKKWRLTLSVVCDKLPMCVSLFEIIYITYFSLSLEISAINSGDPLEDIIVRAFPVWWMGCVWCEELSRFFFFPLLLWACVTLLSIVYTRSLGHWVYFALMKPNFYNCILLIAQTMWYW